MKSGQRSICSRNDATTDTTSETGVMSIPTLTDT